MLYQNLLDGVILSFKNIVKIYLKIFSKKTDSCWIMSADRYQIVFVCHFPLQYYILTLTYNLITYNKLKNKFLSCLPWGKCNVILNCWHFLCKSLNPSTSISGQPSTLLRCLCTYLHLLSNKCSSSSILLQYIFYKNFHCYWIFHNWYYHHKSQNCQFPLLYFPNIASSMSAFFININANIHYKINKSTIFFVWMFHFWS